LAVICNFTPVPRPGYRIGLPHAGVWREVFNSDAAEYGGSGLGNLGAIKAQARGAHGVAASAEVLLPPLCAVYFQFQPDG
jgi:1,4-alpha-glucan branching enzyme